MPATNSISPEKLFRLIGTPGCPFVVDVRTDEDIAADPSLIPGAVRRPYDFVDGWAGDYAGGAVVTVCRQGRKLGAGVAAWLRARGVPAETLEGGTEAWAQKGYATVPEACLPPRDGLGRTIWVTRARPKVDRIACPWLIRRFVDRNATFLFVPPADVEEVAVRFGATPFDVEGVFWSHRGELCTFDVMLGEFGLGEMPALRHLATIVRGADTARPEIAPQAAGLLAVSLGMSRMHADDLEQLEAGMAVYDALYRWCRDAVDETHDWVSHTPKARAKA